MHVLARRLVASIVCFLLASCNTQGDKAESLSDTLASGRFLGESTKASGAGGIAGGAIAGQAARRPGAYADFGNPATSGLQFGTKGAALQEGGASFTLNFVDAELQDFVRSVFEDVLRSNVVVDPSLTGHVTVRTTNPVTKSAALSLVKSVLALNGASLSEADGVYKVARANGDGDRSGGGSFRVIPLTNIDAEQARSALQPFGGDQGHSVALAGGQSLLVTGSDADLDRYSQVLAALDTDQLKGKTFILQPLDSAGASAVAADLSQMFGGAGKSAFRAYPIERMNAVLLMGSNRATLERARAWIRRLDQGTVEQKGVHVYPVQNRDATEVATVLQSMLSATSAASAPQTAPGLTSSSASAPAAAPAADDLDPTTQMQADAAPAVAASVPAPSSSFLGNIAVSADKSTNSLVIIASDQDYSLIEKAIRRLDVMPPQVLIEATIAEVTLNDTLRHGVRWYFQSGNHGLLLSDSSGQSVNPIVPGFNYVFSVTDARLVVNALEGMTKVQVISSPALTVLDNQTATLKVGDQVPIATRSAQSVANPDAPIVSEIEMKDTGIILNVKPRVNASGLVQLDISQEISDVVATTSSSIDSPTIRQRSITSSVVVQSGTDIILGGLISSNTERSRSGLPILKDIPILGEAFTTDALKGTKRTELLIIIKPVVLRTAIDVNAVASEIKTRLFNGG